MPCLRIHWHNIRFGIQARWKAYDSIYFLDFHVFSICAISLSISWFSLVFHNLFLLNLDRSNISWKYLIRKAWYCLIFMSLFTLPTLKKSFSNTNTSISIQRITQLNINLLLVTSMVVHTFSNFSLFVHDIAFVTLCWSLISRHAIDLINWLCCFFMSHFGQVQLLKTNRQWHVTMWGWDWHSCRPLHRKAQCLCVPLLVGSTYSVVQQNLKF